MKQIINSKNAPAPIGPYSQAVQKGSILFCSGQIPLDPQTNQMIGGTVREQTEQVMKNIEAVLAAGGCSFEHVVKTTIFITDMAHFGEVNEVYARFFKDNPPARSTVAVRELPKKALVEIEVIAHQ